MWHLTPDPSTPLRPKLRLVSRREVMSHRVHCAVPECSWSCPCRDVADAEDVLAMHLTQQHGEREH